MIVSTNEVLERESKKVDSPVDRFQARVRLGIWVLVVAILGVVWVRQFNRSRTLERRVAYQRREWADFMLAKQKAYDELYAGWRLNIDGMSRLSIVGSPDDAKNKANLFFDRESPTDPATKADLEKLAGAWVTFQILTETNQKLPLAAQELEAWEFTRDGRISTYRSSQGPGYPASLYHSYFRIDAAQTPRDRHHFR